MDEIRRILASPDVIVRSVGAVTEPAPRGRLGQRKPAHRYAGGSAQAIWVVGARRWCPTSAPALRRIEGHCLPLESERAMKAYGQPSAINGVLILDAEPHPGAAPSCCSAKPSDSALRCDGQVRTGAGGSGLYAVR